MSKSKTKTRIFAKRNERQEAIADEFYYEEEYIYEGVPITIEVNDTVVKRVKDITQKLWVQRGYPKVQAYKESKYRGKSRSVVDARLARERADAEFEEFAADLTSYVASWAVVSDSLFDIHQVDNQYAIDCSVDGLEIPEDYWGDVEEEENDKFSVLIRENNTAPKIELLETCPFENMIALVIDLMGKDDELAEKIMFASARAMTVHRMGDKVSVEDIRFLSESLDESLSDAVETRDTIKERKKSARRAKWSGIISSKRKEGPDAEGTADQEKPAGRKSSKRLSHSAPVSDEDSEVGDTLDGVDEA